MHHWPTCCLIVDIDGFVTRAATASAEWPTKTRNFVSDVINAGLSGYQHADVAVTPPDEWLVTLHAPYAKDLRRQADQIANDIWRDIRASGEVTVTVAVGAVIAGADASRHAMSAARRTHRAKLTYGPDQVLRLNTADTHRTEPLPDIHRQIAYSITRGDLDQARARMWDAFTAATTRCRADETVRRWLLGQAMSATAVLNGRLGTGTAADWLAVCADVPYDALAGLTDLHEPADVMGWIDRLVTALADGRPPVSTTLDLVRQHIDEHVTDPQLSLNNVATAVGVSPFHISHLFRSRLDTTFRDYVTQRRVRHARRLLTQTHLGMTDIAQASGFSSPIQLRRVLVRETGITPTAIRRTTRQH
jgi:AraC-like DNA-binding protein